MTREPINLSEATIYARCRREVDKLRRESNLSEQKLPIEAIREKFKEALEKYDTVLVQATTGAGKSIDIGQMTREALPEAVRIVMTQPRRDAAEGVAIATAARHNLEFGKDVGFSTSEFKGIHDKIPLQVQTTGVLLNRFRYDPLLQHYNAVIIDEAHERDLNIDLCLGLIKRANQRRAKMHQLPIKVVIASATVDAEKFKKFFNIQPAAMLAVEGRMHPVKEHWLKGAEMKDWQGVEIPYPTLAAREVINILKRTPKDQGDILVFMPGMGSIKRVQEFLEAAQEGDQTIPRVEVLSLHGSDTWAHRGKVLAGKSPGGPRRVVISTNMAETSVTVPGIVYVVDGGRKNEARYDHATGLTGLTEVAASQAECRQRKGRAGRTQPGEYVGLMTQEQFSKLDTHPQPEIVRAELTSTILRMIQVGITDIDQFEFVDPPPPEHVKKALGLLEGLGAISPTRGITPLGEKMVRLPLESRLACAVARAQEIGCVKEVVEIAGLIEECDRVFRSRPDVVEEQYAQRLLANPVELQKAITQREELLRKRISDREGSEYRTQSLIDLQIRATQKTLQLLKDIQVQRGEKPSLGKIARTMLEEKAAPLRAQFDSDWEMYTWIMKRFKAAPIKELFCNIYGFDQKVITQAIQRSEEIIAHLIESEVEISSSAHPKAVERSILAGFLPDQAIRFASANKGYERLDREGRKILLGSQSLTKVHKPQVAVCLTFKPGTIEVYSARKKEMVKVDVFFAGGVHPVDPQQLREVAPHLVRRVDEDRFEFKTQTGKWVNL